MHFFKQFNACVSLVSCTLFSYMLVSESNQSVNEHEELENTKKIRYRGKIIKNTD